MRVCSATGTRCNMIHDNISKREEARRVEGLCEEVRQVRVSSHEGHLETHIFDALSNEEMPALYVLHAGVMLRVISDSNS